MKSEPNFAIFLQAFSYRIEIAKALFGILDSSREDLDRTKEASLQLKSSLSTVDHCYVSDQYRAYNTAIALFVILAEWKHALRNAEPDAQRYLCSAKLQSSEAKESLSFAADIRLDKFLEKVEAIDSVDELPAIQKQLKQWTLPLLLFASHTQRKTGKHQVRSPKENLEDPANKETTVAFLKFEIDGEPATQYNYLKPGMAYDLTVEVRVSNWPRGAGNLSLLPVTIDPRERDWLPSFKFEKPEGAGPFTFTGTGRAALELANSFGSRPYEFLFAAEFDDMRNCRDVAIVGHRRLLLEGSDVNSNPLTGFSNVDRHLLSIRDKLRNFPGLHSTDVANAMIVLGGLGNIAAQALKGGFFETGISEADFQGKASEMLRNRSDIGEHLQGHPEAAGGITDLTFRDIPVELKVENSKVLFPKDLTKYFDQTAAYAIGLGKRIGILSVLEVSPKSAPVGVVEEDIEVFTHKTGRSSIAIVVVVIRGGFPKPSSYSR